MGVLATIVIAHGEGVSAGSVTVKAEFDDRRNVNPDGTAKTIYNPGDIVYIRVHHDSTVRVRDVKATDGSIAGPTSLNYRMSQQMIFAVAGEQISLDYIPSGGVTWVFKGRQGSGMLTIADKAQVSGGLPCLSESVYSVAFKGYALQTPPNVNAVDGYPIAIIIYIEAV